MSDEKKNDVKAISYELRAKSDGIHLTLSLTHRYYLRYLSEREGQAEYDSVVIGPDVRKIAEDKKISEQEAKRLVNEHIRLLVSNGCITELPVVGRSGVFIHRLTTQGQNLIPLIVKATS